MLPVAQMEEDMHAGGLWRAIQEVTHRVKSKPPMTNNNNDKYITKQVYSSEPTTMLFGILPMFLDLSLRHQKVLHETNANRVTKESNKDTNKTAMIMELRIYLTDFYLTIKNVVSRVNKVD